MKQANRKKRGVTASSGIDQQIRRQVVQAASKASRKSQVCRRTDQVRTQKKSAERQIELLAQNETLRESQSVLEMSCERLTNLYDSAPVAYLTLDPSGKISEINLKGCELLGADRNALLGGEFQRFLASSDAAAFQLYCRRLTDSEKLQRCEVRLVKKTGVLLHVQMDGIVTANHAANGRRFRLCLIDANERNMVEQTRRKSEEQYRLLFERHPYPTCVFDAASLRFLEVNQEAIRCYGYSREEFMTLRIKDLYLPEDAPRLLVCLSNFVPGPKATGTWRHRKKDGKLVNVEVCLRPVPFADKNALLMVAKDVIGARVETERTLRESEASKRAVLESALDAIVTTDHEGKILEFNSAAERIFGCGRAEAIGRFMADLIIPLAFRQQYLGGVARYMATGERQTRGQRAEIIALRRDGSQFPVELTLTRVGAGSPPIFAAFIRDISERRWMEQKLRSSREQLRGLVRRSLTLQEEERARVARELEEELGQLLSFVKLELSLTDFQRSQPDSSATSATIVQKLDSVSQIIDQAQEEVRALAVQLRPLELDRPGLLAALEVFLKEVRSKTGLDCQLTLPARKLPMTPALATALYRICQEAVTNVIRHAQATKLCVSLVEQGGDLLLSVRDNGIGISEAQVDRSTALGILSMRERARVFAGEVHVAPAASSGTTVTVQIPLEAKAKAGPGKISDENGNEDGSSAERNGALSRT